MSPADRTVAHLRLAAEAAAQHHAARMARAEPRATKALRQRDGYRAVIATLNPTDPRRSRAAALADWAAHRALAWQSVADGDPDSVRAHQRYARRCFRAAMAIQIA